MSRVGEILDTLTTKVNRLESSSLVLSEALHYGNNSVKSYSGAMDLLYAEISELVELCEELSCNCN